MALLEPVAFWLFWGLLLAILTVLVLVGKALAPSRPSSVKHSTYECGQAPSGKAHDFTISGANRYFVYGVIFFSLDASALILLTSAIVVTSALEVALLVAAYAMVVAALLVYFTTALRRSKP